MAKSLYITATDTDAGKTVITALLAEYLQSSGHRVITQKPIQSGCDGFPEDIAEHLKIMGKNPSEIDKDLLNLICPYRFKLPASAHLAASLEQCGIETKVITDAHAKLTHQFDYILVEGIGGALVPISTQEPKCTISDIAADLKIPAIVIANNKLGVINHTLMTLEVLKNRKIDVLGFILNGSDKNGNTQVLKDNPKAISDYSGIECLGQLPWSENITELKTEFKAIGQKIFSKLINT